VRCELGLLGGAVLEVLHELRAADPAQAGERDVGDRRKTANGSQETAELDRGARIVRPSEFSGNHRLDTAVLRSFAMDAIQVGHAAARTGWSARMLR